MGKHIASACCIDPAWRMPALRPNRANMSPAAFFGLVAVWSGASTGLLLIMIFLRLIS